jgi:hypothetical protein
MTYTAREVDQEIAHREGWDNLVYKTDGYLTAVLLQNEPVVLTKVASKNSDEETDSAVWVVVRVGGQYFRKEGYYQSHYGTEWDGSVHEVWPKEKTVTVYENNNL